MSDSRDPKYFVVGGPVQPGRECYLQRAADAELFRRIEEREYCYVLAQRQTGKTSLVASTAARLRALERPVAVVDLTQASEEDPSENAGRWYYSIAYRIVRDLRIKADLQSWWAERGGLTNLQRLREFFNEVVLAETDQPIVVFFDRIEATLGEPLAQDLFSAIRACYDARATDSDFLRLTFVVLGCAAPAELVKNVQGSPFEIATAIELPDFSPQELAGLMGGLGQPVDDEEQVVQRIWSWTRGHPYLSQKVFRGLARRREEEITTDTVDELVQSQFMGAQVISEEPHMSAIADRLLANPGRAQRLNLYGRIRKGVDVMRDASSAPQGELLTAGIVKVGEGGYLRVRNEIYAMVFDMPWINQNLPYGFKGIGIGAALLAAVVLVPIWYTEYLPRPYVQALSGPNQDYAAATEAYDSLHRLPGYGATADRLYESFLQRQGQKAETLPEITRISNRLAQLPGRAERAREQIAAFWDRRAERAVDQGNRDNGLVALLEALQIPTDSRRARLGELVGDDYRALVATLHAGSDLTAVEVDRTAGRVALLDQQNRVAIWNLDGDAPRLLRSVELIAEERPELSERRLVEQSGRNPRLYIETTHPQPQQVEVIVRAPTGRDARVRLADARVVEPGIYRFDFNSNRALKALAGQELAGNWSVSLTDLEAGVTGDLLGWGLEFDGLPYRRAGDRTPQPIPEPRPSDNAEARLGADGRMGLSWPASPDTQGSVLVWDLFAGQVLTRVPRGEEMTDARLVLDGQRVVTIEPRRFAVWDAATGQSLGEIPLTTSQPLRMSPNRRYAAVAVRRQNAKSLIQVWDLETVRRVGVSISGENAGPVAIDSAGRYLAIGGRDPWVRIWSLADGNLVREFAHGSPLRSVRFDAAGAWLATDDLSSTLRVWNVREGGAPVIERFGISPWQADFAADGSHVMFGSAERSFEVMQLPEGMSAGVRIRHSRRGPGNIEPHLLTARNLAVTSDGLRAVKVWSIASDAPTPVRRLRSGSRAALSPDGERIARGTTDGEVRLQTVGASAGGLPDDGTALIDESSPATEIIYLAFSADGRMVAAASIDGRVRVWNTVSGTLRDLPINHADGGAHDLVFIDDGERLVSVSRREVLVTQTSTGEIQGRLRIQANHPQLAVAAASDEVFIADDLDGVTLWNWRTGQSERIVSGDYKVRAVAVSADGQRMVTASDGGELVLWNVAERIPAPTRVSAAAKVDDIRLLSDGGLLVQAGYWLQRVDVFPAGLAIRHTRLLSDAPSALQPLPDSRRVRVLNTLAGRNAVTELSLVEPRSAPLAGDPAELAAYWRDRLGLDIDEQGLFIPRIVSEAP